MNILYKTLSSTALVLTAIVMFGCRPSKDSSVPQPRFVQLKPNIIGSKTMAMPGAVAYRTNGDYAPNVAIRLGKDGMPVYYPAPTDVTDQSSALPLTDGWYLDRCGGIGTGTVFLRTTYSQYAALDSTPGIKWLLAEIIPGAKVTAMRRLPLTLPQALADTAAVNRLLAAPFK